MSCASVWSLQEVRYNSQEFAFSFICLAALSFRLTKPCLHLTTNVHIKAVILSLPNTESNKNMTSLTLYRRSGDCFIYRPRQYRAVNTFLLGYKNQSVYAVSGTSRCLFSDKYNTHKFSVGRAYSC
jgi:hypothetical protein